MCGIFLYKTNKQNAEEIVLQGLKKLEYRGYDSFGIASINISKENNPKINLQKFVGKVSLAKLDFVKSNLAFGHTRWATHGKVTKENSHPHISQSGRFVVVHNGIFENYLDFKKQLEENGFKFCSQTDTEVIANFVEFEIQKIPLVPLKGGTDSYFYKVVKNFSKQIKGGNAFIILDSETNELVVSKNGSALYIGKNKNSEEIFVSSDRQAILELGEPDLQMYSMQDGDVISLNYLDKLKFEKPKMSSVLISKNKEVETGAGYFTLKEIFDQKQTTKQAYEKNKILEIFQKKNWQKKNIFASGCGTAYHAALMFANLAAQKGINVKAIPANESGTVKKIINKDTILFLFSQSGETADSIIFAKQVLKNGGKVYTVLNSEHSTLSEISSQNFLIHCGKEIAVASTKAFTGMILTSLKLLNFKISKNEFKELEKFINLELLEKIKNIVKNYLYSKDIFVIGKGVENIIALETALKIKETSYIHAEGFAAGELKHGVLALIQEKVLTIVLATNGKSDMENASLQIKARNGELLGIGFENKNYYDHFIEIPKNVSNLSFVFSAIVGQILAYEFAIGSVFDPDKPRNLAKSVTVK